MNTFASKTAKVTRADQFRYVYHIQFRRAVNGTIGGLYWSEQVDNLSNSITTQASGSHCFWNSENGQLFEIDDACTGYTEAPAAPYLAAASPFRPSHPTRPGPEHMSIYGALDIELSDTWTLSFEGRYNKENVDVYGPIFYEPDAGGGPGGLNVCGIFFRACDPFEQWLADGNWFSDSFFPWTDEAIDGTDLNAFIPDQQLLDNIPICAGNRMRQRSSARLPTGRFR